MKNDILLIGALILFFSYTPIANGQNKGKVNSDVLKITTQFPVENLKQSDLLMDDILALGEPGIMELIDMLVPAGTGNDSQVRYALNSLAIYSASSLDSKNNSIVENALLKGLESEADIEIKTFLMNRLNFCGTDKSIAELNKYLSHKQLYEPSIDALYSIETNNSAQAILAGLDITSDISMQPQFIEYLGKMKYSPAIPSLEKLSTASSNEVKKTALYALSNIASEQSNKVLYNATKKSNFKIDESEAILSYINYGNRLIENGDAALGKKIGDELMKNCKNEDQLLFRLAGLNMIQSSQTEDITETLIKESKNPNAIYRGGVLDIASKDLTSTQVQHWVKAYKKATPESKTQLLYMLEKRTEPEVLNNCIQPALSDSNKSVRIAGIKALAYQDKEKAIPLLKSTLKTAQSQEEYDAIEQSLLRLCTTGDTKDFIKDLGSLNESGKIVLVNLWKSKQTKSAFESTVNLLNENSSSLNNAVYKSLPFLATPGDIDKLLELLVAESNPKNISELQNAIVTVVDQNPKIDISEHITTSWNSSTQKDNLIPLLAVVGDQESLDEVVKLLKSGSEEQKLIALKTLSNWRTNDAIPYLFAVASTSDDPKLRKMGFESYLKQVISSTYPDAQKLLLIREIEPYANSTSNLKNIIRSSSKIKSFSSFVYVSKFIENSELTNMASSAAISIALPTPSDKNGLQGEVVKEIVTKSINNLSGPDSQYLKIDVKEFLENMDSMDGFLPIFNGSNLEGWQGLVENPIARSKMASSELSKKQTDANKAMHEDWRVHEEMIQFVGEGFKNICTVKKYKDIEMLVDWRIGAGGDSGIYLRGTPQVQIWDTALIKVGAQVGSGGLYNNKKHESKPLIVADNPINHWNTFRIMMIDDKVTVYLNGQLVVDAVVFENYWDSNQSIFPIEAIELQAHGEDVRFRDIYVREIEK